MGGRPGEGGWANGMTWDLWGGGRDYGVEAGLMGVGVWKLG